MTINSPIHRVLNCANRGQKRQSDREVLFIIEKYKEVEDSFIEWLFDDKVKFSYKAIYNIHLAAFLQVTENLTMLKRFKYTAPNSYYFADNFKPIENV